MSVVKIVHLSDLHFAISLTKDLKIWDDNLVPFINEKIQPDAILVTGDVTDSAKEEEFQLARAKLDMLRVKVPQAGRPSYYIIPGNHDRYYLGNNILSRFIRSSRAMRFDTYFAGRYPQPKSVVDLQLGANGSTWNVRIIGIDSNHPKAWFAQGAVEETAAKDAATSALAASDVDLVVGLVHHHVLPIPAIEKAAMMAKGLRNVANVTGMLNSGVLLEYLSDAQVNIVLHGHEHSPHHARFTGSTRFAGPVVVVAAGSGTGEETLVGWDLSRIHFNVLELEPDRSVYLTQYHHPQTQFTPVGPRHKLLSGGAIRRSRFVRRNREEIDADKQGLPTSRYKKLVNIDVDRSATIVETKTDIALDSGWSLTTRNASGNIDGWAEVEFEWPDGTTESFLTPFQRTPDGDHEAFECGVPLDKVRLARRVTATWVWSAAVLLTALEAVFYPPEVLSELRRAAKGEDRREFLVLKIDDEFEEAAMVVNLPDGVGPDRDDWRVDIQRPGSTAFEPSQELTKLLEFCGPGHIELRIPYPLPGFRYLISWKLPDIGDNLDETVRIAGLLSSRANDLLTEAVRIMGGSVPVNVALYGLDTEQMSLIRLASTNDRTPSTLTLQTPRSRGRAALLGGVERIHPAQDNGDIAEGELFVVLAPITKDDCDISAGVLRVAPLDAADVDWDGSDQMEPEAAAFFERAISASNEIVRLALLEDGE